MLPWEATERVLAGEDPETEWAEQSVDNTWSSCWAISRESWDAVGGFDERFVGWGAEDWMWMSACHALFGIVRAPGNSFHLWHGRDGEGDHPHYDKNIALGNRYLAVRNEEAPMRKLLAEPGGPLHGRAPAFSNVGKWDVAHRGLGEIPRPYGATDTYPMGARWLASCDLIEDWGCGAGWFSFLVEEKRYRGIDGSKTPFAAEIADLAEYRSKVPGIYMRHVLEHDYRWKQILDNALASFTERMALVLFTPISSNGTHDIEWEDPPGVPNLSFSLDELCERMDLAKANYDVVTVEGGRHRAKYGAETMFLLKR
jgi:hypothetical protein